MTSAFQGTIVLLAVVAVLASVSTLALTAMIVLSLWKPALFQKRRTEQKSQNSGK